MTHASKSPRAAKALQRSGGLSELLSPRLFKALGDPRRVSLLIRLAELRGERTVGEIAEGSNVDLSVVSRHLGILRDAGIIRCERRGKEVYCRIEATNLVPMLRQLADALEGCCVVPKPKTR